MSLHEIPPFILGTEFSEKFKHGFVRTVPDYLSLNDERLLNKVQSPL